VKSPKTAAVCYLPWLIARNVSNEVFVFFSVAAPAKGDRHGVGRLRTLFEIQNLFHAKLFFIYSNRSQRRPSLRALPLVFSIALVLRDGISVVSQARLWFVLAAERVVCQAAEFYRIAPVVKEGASERR